MAKMKCEELLQQLSDYVDGSADPVVCKELEKHIASCHPCEVVLDTLRNTITVYKAGERLELPVAFRDRLHDCLRRRWKEQNG